MLYVCAPLSLSPQNTAASPSRHIGYFQLLYQIQRDLLCLSFNISVSYQIFLLNLS
ncbi:hypothetical protein GCWU000246_01744 [Jonquetella anthropi E3_33 E1]|nr:hypothetical protein GCWU000246_01744 [Jonquetella anthropi E3_33 E1]